MTGYDYRTLDDVIHSRVRLAIMSYLMTAREADFGELKAQLKLTDGNLSTHLRKLEDHAYISVTKGFAGRKPQTTVAITNAGDAAFKTYLEGLASMLGPTAG